MNLRLFACTVFIMFTCFAGLAYPADYAVVDFQKAMDQCSLGQGAKQKIQGIFKNYDNEVMGMQKNLMKIKSELEQTGQSQEKTALENKYKGEVDKYNKHTANLKNILQSKNTEYTRLVLNKIVENVKIYNRLHRTGGNDTKYIAIFEKAGNKSLQDSRGNKQINVNSVDLAKADDITDEIIKLMNEKYPYEKYSHLFK